MTAQEFVTRRSPDWARLEALLKRGRRGRLGGLEPDDVLSLAGLYRQATADLARAVPAFFAGETPVFTGE